MKKRGELNFDLKQLRSFMEVLNENSFTRASRKLRVGQATISHHIMLLEKALGVKLVNRTARDVSATEEGRVFRTFCEKLFKNIESVRADLDRGARSGTTRIAASSIPAAYILPGILAAVRREFPGVTYRLQVTDSREAVEMVKEGSADVGIVGKEHRHPSLLYTPFCSDEIVLVGPKGSPAAISVAELTGMPLIIREAGSGTRKSSEEALGRQGVTPSALQVVLESSSTESIKESIAAGLGVSFLSRLAVQQEKRAKSLTVIGVKGLAIQRSFYFVHGGSRQLSRAAQLLLDSLIEFGKMRD
ncbi:MAG TPA: selenium metabolism-associated LysR family transcriptional regulator [Spirochaetota bacterium]|nr:selenium metabolism-associated LysR family transcriptional regulator [Spirochaetota bacterium]HPC43240.1 selenium metabolism-associated LysR family transcriptional regulator [Spirochaetota bacterium]HPL16520.1 selenium metabolism-associated LysR family transcriptional regulator [Spirochaetota bacterium]HQF06679.1 selenium metabolism-associated LysR family transcriptional regulator [Spirochaetota bacterium]HQH95918.1 selenium metabolism-associated LysR family transcriptional regulator [Spiroc